ncbi:MAG: hypothetical protein WC494_02190 [Candidatus Pacearchaeota archaeon]
MAKTDKISSRFRKGIMAGLIAIIGATNVAISKTPKTYLESTLVSDYVARHGMFKKGTVNQNLVYVDFKNGFSGFAWGNYDFKENAVNEIDGGVSYAHNLTDELSANIGFQHWYYPSGEFGTYDNVFKAGLKLGGTIDLEYDLTHLLGHDETPTGDRHYFKASKTFNLGKISGTNVSITPSISTALLDDYYGTDGWSQITPGVSLDVSKGKWNLKAFINQQHGKVYDDLTWGGISLGYSF